MAIKPPIMQTATNHMLPLAPLPRTNHTTMPDNYHTEFGPLLLEIKTDLVRKDEQLRNILARIEDNRKTQDKENQETSAKIKALEAKVDALETDLNKRKGLKEGITWILAIVSALLGLLGGKFIWK